MTDEAKFEVKNKVCLIVHDGWGISDTVKGNAIHAASTENMTTLAKENSYIPLAAHGLAVGLSDGLMGNSEVGHLNIGAGRIVYQDIVRIDESIRKGDFKNTDSITGGGKVIADACQNALSNTKRLHFLGLISDGGVHSHITHLYALLETANQYDLEIYVHFFGDGRDTAPTSAAGYLKDLLKFIADKNIKAKVATIVGRYYAMDRDKRWDRVKIAVDALVQGKPEGKPEIEVESNVTVLTGGGASAVEEVERNYAKEQKVTDEFLKPIVVGDDEDPEGRKGRIQEGDTLFFFNYRSDRMREITSVFGIDPKPMDVKVPKNLHISTMSRYKAEFPFPVAFPPQAMDNVLAEVLAQKGLNQAHIAETEKYAHVTFFFNGGVEKKFDNEDRHMIPSPNDVATYDLKPEMSAQGVADKVAETVKEKDAHGKSKYDFVMCNFAPPDMVGHTGKYDAAVQAIGHTDAAVGTVYKACQEEGYILFVTADHGNAEQMLNPDTGAPHTAHTTNPVPFIMAGLGKDLFITPADTANIDDAPKLADVAPTILAVMGIEAPQDMGGRSLLATK